MIQRNPLKTPVLITADEVAFHAPIDKDYDPRSLWQNVIIAERRFVKPALGWELYARLIGIKNVVVTSSNRTQLQQMITDQQALTPAGQKQREEITLAVGDMVNSDSFLTSPTDLALWRDHLHKICAEAVYFQAIPTNRARFKAQGVIKNFPDNVGGSGDQATIDLDETRHLMDKAIQDRIQPLLDDMHFYLCGNRYPDYIRAGDCPGCAGSAPLDKTGLLTMYPEDLVDDCSCGTKSGYPGDYFVPMPPVYIPPTPSAQPINEVVGFYGVDMYVLPWTPERIAKFGTHGLFQVLIQNEDGALTPSLVQVAPDDPQNPSNYTFDLGGVHSGRIIIA